MDFHQLVAILLGAISLKKNCPAIIDANNHKIDNYYPCIFVNNSAFSASIFTNSNLFESSGLSGHIYKIYKGYSKVSECLFWKSITLYKRNNLHLIFVYIYKHDNHVWYHQILHDIYLSFS